MLPVPVEVMEQANSQQSAKPMLLAIVYADDGPNDRILSAYRLAGNGDPGSSGDSNVAEVNASLDLATGGVVGLDTSTATGAVALTSLWQGTVKELGGWVWG